MTPKFSIGDTIAIPAIEFQEGIVLAVQWYVYGISVKVGYWMDGERREVWLLEKEIQSV